jgi:uncharacterized protein YbjT (DUF2867 family)
MRIVVFGATGNIGTAAVSALTADPEVRSVVGVARRRPTTAPAKVEWAAADTATDRLEPLLEAADACVCLAWLIQPARDPPCSGG